jgi:hypothetical protein
MRILCALCCLALASPSLGFASDRCWETLGALPTRGGVTAVAVGPDDLVVALLDHDVLVVDISDPASPRVAADVRTPGHPVDVAISGDRAYLVQYDFGLQILDFSEPEKAVLVGTLTTSCAGQAVAVADNRAWWTACRRVRRSSRLRSGSPPCGGVNGPSFSNDIGHLRASRRPAWWL